VTGQPIERTAAADDASLRRDRVTTWIGIGAGLLAIMLVVFGALRLWSASDDNSAADGTRAQIHRLRQAEVAARRVRGTLNAADDALAQEVQAMANTSRQIGAAENSLTEAFNAATNQATSGDLGGARAVYQAQSGALHDLDAKLADLRQHLAAAQQRLADLQRLEQRP
jgi:chromosome segregation ATPase